ncbi:MAG: hypothetical protein KDA41_14480 [Planctomycetales bacterium]|nr:hypothetical protein [Planctomycetales bacterium]
MVRTQLCSLLAGVCLLSAIAFAQDDAPAPPAEFASTAALALPPAAQAPIAQVGYGQFGACQNSGPCQNCGGKGCAGGCCCTHFGDFGMYPCFHGAHGRLACGHHGHGMGYYACGGAAAVHRGYVGSVNAGDGYYPDLFYNYYAPQSAAGGVPTDMYPAPHYTPWPAIQTYYTYQLWLPHELMYEHHRTYLRQYNGGNGYTKTRVTYGGSPLRKLFETGF